MVNFVSGVTECCPKRGTVNNYPHCNTIVAIPGIFDTTSPRVVPQLPAADLQANVL